MNINFNLHNKELQKFHGNINRRNVIGYEKYLDGLRGLAIALVFATHANFLTSIGYLGVDIFFVVSGFVIAKQLSTLSNISFRKFFIKRFSRLAPAMYLVIVVALIFKITNIPIMQISLKEAFASLLWVKNFSSWGSGLDFLWSVSAEIQVYLVFAIIQFWIRHKSRRFQMSLWLGMFVGLQCLMIITYLRTSAESFNQDGFVYLTIGRPSAFFLGVALTLYSGIHISLIVRAAALLTIPLVILIPIPTTVALFTASIIIYCQHYRIVRSKLEGKYLVSVGVLSYSIYLWHILTIEIMRHLISNKAIQLIASIGVVLSLASASYLFFELPIRSRIQKLAGRL